MAKKRKKSGGRRPTRSVRSPAADGTVKQLASTWNLPVIAGASDTKAANAYLEQFMVFEMALLDDSLDAVDQALVPHEHRYLMQRWPDSFEFFRHALWLYAERALRLNPWTATLRSLLVRSRAADRSGFEDLDSAITTGLERFRPQRRNVLQQVNDDPRLDARERFRVIVKLYAEMYEVDFPLWLVGVLGKSYSSGRLNPEAFGGPLTTTPQGSLVDAAAAAATGTPLEPLLRSAYIPGLRNAINHNDYELIFGGPSANALAGVRKVSTGETWDADAVQAAWQSTSDLINAAMTCAASVGEVLVPASRGEFVDSGVLSIEYAVVGGIPYALIAQLWCFREVDPEGSWLDSTEFAIERESSGVERAGFSSRAWMSGAPISDGLVGEALRERNWIRTLRLPVAPNMGLGLPQYHHPLGGVYEVVGTVDEHDVPVKEGSPFASVRNLVDTRL